MEKILKPTPLTKRLLMLYALNVTDWIFTLILVNTGYFYEANLFMNYAISNIWLGALLKCIVPLLLILCVNNRMTSANKKQLSIAKKLINVIILYYIIINSSHIMWLTVFNALL